MTGGVGEQTMTFIAFSGKARKDYGNGFPGLDVRE